MFSRRDVVKLGAVGLVAPAFGATTTPVLSAAQQKSRDVPMFRGNAARTGEMPGPAPDGANGIEVRWTLATIGRMPSSPAVVDDTVFVGSLDGNLYALDTENGTEKWRFTIGDQIWSSPAVATDCSSLVALMGLSTPFPGASHGWKWAQRRESRA
jgi:hypothetical protein